MDQHEMTDNERSGERAAEILKIRVSLKGRPIRTQSFTKDVITLGRDPESDVFLDNPGISRTHLKIEKTADGYCAEDLGSANGTYLNDELFQRRLLANEDVLRIGKFTLWVSLEDDRRHSSTEKPASGTTYQGTTVLSTGELEKMMTKLKNFDHEPQVDSEPVHVQTAKPPRARVAVITVAFILGIALGVGMTWFVIR